jgi:hypothetical protein
MKKESGSLFRRALMPVAATAVTLGALLGLPALKALAAAQDWKISPIRPVARPLPALNIIQPAFVNPTTKKLLSIADQALANDALAERIFSNPDAVAAEYGLSENETMVLRHMNREQFQVAQADAARLTAERLAAAGPRRLPPSVTDAGRIAEGMIVGRAILAAVGRSYLDAANAHACCPWGKAIELGVNPSRVFYDEVFARPAAIDLRQQGLEAPALDVRAPRPEVRAPKPD